MVYKYFTNLLFFICFVCLFRFVINLMYEWIFSFRVTYLGETVLRFSNIQNTEDKFLRIGKFSNIFIELRIAINRILPGKI